MGGVIQHFSVQEGGEDAFFFFLWLSPAWSLSIAVLFLTGTQSLLGSDRLKACRLHTNGDSRDRMIADGYLKCSSWRL